MNIHKVESIEHKGRQHWQMVYHCIVQWCRLNNTNYQSYYDVMNMKTYKYNYEHHYFVSLTYHINLKKW